ncbi:MAG: RNA 2',3'-cyclic phosphodiesterase [Chloroflexota bacterium]|nr:RNA 2',3'-cyclic phosphodiesterase [Chloroflexota bacterium]
MIPRDGPAEEASPLRLFVAIDLPDDVKQALGAAIESLRTALQSDALRWVRPDGIHLTLQFLGATSQARVPDIAFALEAAVRGVPAFGLAAGTLGSFGGRQRLRVIWLGLSGDEPAAAHLAARVHSALQPLGFAPDREPFRPHLTLASVRDDASREERQRLYDMLRRTSPPVPPPFRVERISLMQSTLARGGAVYQTLARFSLAAVTATGSGSTNIDAGDRRPTTDD